MMFSHLITFISSFSGPLMTIWCDTVKKGKFKRIKNKVIISIQSKLFNMSFFSCTRYPSSLPSSNTLYFDVKQARDTFFTFHNHFSLFGITICNAICSLHFFFQRRKGWTLNNFGGGLRMRKKKGTKKFQNILWLAVREILFPLQPLFSRWDTTEKKSFLPVIFLRLHVHLYAIFSHFVVL